MEEWRPISGYEKLYAVSDHGRVKSLKRLVVAGGGVRIVPEKILLLEAHIKGYKRIMICKLGACERFFVHRLVAEAFLPSAHTTEVVNHKDGNKENNTIENLEWATFSENTQHYHAELKPKRIAEIPPTFTFTPDELPW